MDLKGKSQAIWKEIARHLFIPRYAFLKNLRHFQSAKEEHKQNIIHIKDLYTRAKGLSRSKPEADQAIEQSFADMMRTRPAGAPSSATLQRRFLNQKRLALATGFLFFVMSVCAIAHHNWLGISTLLGGIPLFFMACLSAQFRLWQLRSQRLSRAEKGGLGDFMREPGWISCVLDPELGHCHEEQQR